eukprot:1146070-Pelagomonas_calceolata.AAC.5
MPTNIPTTILNQCDPLSHPPQQVLLPRICKGTYGTVAAKLESMEPCNRQTNRYGLLLLELARTT